MKPWCISAGVIRGGFTMNGTRQRRDHDATNGHSVNGKPATSNGHTNGLVGKSTHGDQATTEGAFTRFINRVLVPLFLMSFPPNLSILLWFTAARCDGSFMKLFAYLGEEGIFSGVLKIWLNINLGSSLSVGVLLGYMLFAIILHVTLPGPRATGPVTPKGNQPVYCDNGFKCYVVTIIAFVGLTYGLKQYGLTPTVVYDHFDEFLATLTVYTHILCIFLHIKGLTFPSSSDCGSSGNVVFDYYWGTELYPRIFGIDIKVVTNCRFGMTVWPLLCLIFALKSYETYGFVDSMWVSCALQMMYFTKFFWWESGYMNTIDIMLDRAGFYICWGCLVFIPGTYASVSMYLVDHPVHLGLPLALTTLLLGASSVAINYIADRQKQQVRRTNGECLIWGRKPEVIRAKYQLENGEWRESLLLVSGYWGIARHFHYVPELALTFFWSVPGLFENVMVYVYFIWLCILLSHRTFRDDAKCFNKYKKYWVEYCERVPYKMIPGIF